MGRYVITVMNYKTNTVYKNATNNRSSTANGSPDSGHIFKKRTHRATATKRHRDACQKFFEKQKFLK